MWPYHPDLLAVPVPRYTSYPTAAEFGELAPEQTIAAIESADGDISLYVHIPFCEKICHYCGCNTAAAGKRQRMDAYMVALHHEIETVASLLPKTARVRRVSFGGGSPNAIDPIDFVRLMDHLTVHFHLADPILSIELDPRTMTDAWAGVISAIGFERASLGVQTFATHCQEAIGRVQSEDLIVRTVDWLRDAGVESLNFDLMYGLPGQNTDDLIDSMHRTRVLGADRVAVFGYAHVPHIVKRQSVIDAAALPGPRERFAMAQLAFSYFCTHGYAPVGFDHFAMPGRDPLARAALSGTLRRNFQGFTDDQAPVLIGLGSSAISCFPGLLSQNEKNAGRYRVLTGEGRLPIERGICRTAEDQIRGTLIEDVLCKGEAVIPPTLLAEAKAMIAPFSCRGLADITGDRLQITPDGLPYARTIAAQFDPWRKQSARRFSSAI
ncbi:oxygen-independent coproporphyrinogen III oxidase [Croceicoccus mobilis]|uniref:Coproporphyrinogen-III oxidase n=1 Tax=Croceicoccus mobilis TaxID=1703339 RepID=A0A917DVR8_9SPHN|nr:oxygen-independent coproporphyrinogen III oxidase [Croceicoccus mobilis]GGD73309.1 coproporphyrinogen-III oxidase [Croceicoccus mobilis]